jgi:DNA-binding Lrp family transcriptional regulator
MDIDEVDRRVLAALFANARADAAEVGEAADVGPTTATWRREAMEGAGVIRGYEPRLDYGPLGFPVTALLQLEVDPAAREAVADRLAADPRLVTVYEVTGPPDLVAVGRFRDRGDLDRACRELREADGIRRLRARPVRPVAERDLPGED